jgi:16S rRNA (adenine1518-N6/adenine1519-N6)-dimethyltransferase
MPKPRKRFGQNFLTDEAVIASLVNAIGPKSEDIIVEIGPGQAALTQALLPSVQALTAVEIDRDLVAWLEKHLADWQNFRLISADALQFDFSQLAGDKAFRLVGNLPYNISTPLLFHLFASIAHIQDMHFMLQKEVVQRLTAPVGDGHYGKLSVMTQFYCHNQSLVDIPPEAFYPAPKVDSAFVRLTPHAKRPDVDIKQLHKVVFQAFSQRRKRISNTLKNLISASDLAALGIDTQKRPQELSVADYVMISQALPNSWQR